MISETHVKTTDGNTGTGAVVQLVRETVSSYCRFCSPGSIRKAVSLGFAPSKRVLLAGVLTVSVACSSVQPASEYQRQQPVNEAPVLYAIDDEDFEKSAVVSRALMSAVADSEPEVVALPLASLTTPQTQSEPTAPVEPGAQQFFTAKSGVASNESNVKLASAMTGIINVANGGSPVTSGPVSEPVVLVAAVRPDPVGEIANGPQTDPPPTPVASYVQPEITNNEANEPATPPVVVADLAEADPVPPVEETVPEIPAPVTPPVEKPETPAASNTPATPAAPPVEKPETPAASNTPATPAAPPVEKPETPAASNTPATPVTPPVEKPETPAASNTPATPVTPPVEKPETPAASNTPATPVTPPVEKPETPAASNTPATPAAPPVEKPETPAASNTPATPATPPVEKPETPAASNTPATPPVEKPETPDVPNTLDTPSEDDELEASDAPDEPTATESDDESESPGKGKALGKDKDE